MASDRRCKLGSRAHSTSAYLINKIHGKQMHPKAIRKISSWATLWAKTVMARDEMTCQLCGTTDGELHAHHIVPQSVARQLAKDVANGITLCAACHRKWHAIKTAESGIKEARKQAA